MPITLQLDKDLAARLRKDVSGAGYAWDTLPLEFRLKFLKPYLREQKKRERAVVREACRVES